jgi:TrmH family RNA methyltransferase
MTQDKSKFAIILQEPKIEGNVGAVARSIKNFGFKQLYLVNSCELGEECFKRSKHAKDIIQNAKHFNTLDEVMNEVDFLIGTTGIINSNDKHRFRNPITPRQLIKLLNELDDNDRIGLMFGREDYGLYQKELLHCDLVVTIPTDDEYPVMNLSHAVAVVLYELSSAELKFEIRGHRETEQFERDLLYKQFEDFLDTVDYPKHKRENTEVLFRRLIGRATPSKWEFHTMMGVFGRAGERMKKFDEERLGNQKIKKVKK